jgi:23S rRNA (guanosine2251-2'-O)-methyltransferase
MAKKRSEQTHDYDVIFGLHSVTELLRAKKRRLLRIYTTKPTPKGWSALEKLLPKGLQIQYVDRDALAKLAGTTDHQSVVALATPFVYAKTFFDTTKHPFLLLLDQIQDARNLGAILRSAYCTNVSGVILTQNHSATITGAALKSSAGLAEHLTIYQVPTAQAAAVALKKAGYTMYLSLIDGKESVHAITYRQPACLVVGNEATGISKEIHSQGIGITLAQKTPDISYNASVAAGIILYQMSTQFKMI